MAEVCLTEKGKAKAEELTRQKASHSSVPKSGSRSGADQGVDDAGTPAPTTPTPRDRLWNLTNHQVVGGLVVAAVVAVVSIVITTCRSPETESELPNPPSAVPAQAASRQSDAGATRYAMQLLSVTPQFERPATYRVRLVPDKGNGVIDTGPLDSRSGRIDLSSKNVQCVFEGGESGDLQNAAYVYVQSADLMPDGRFHDQAFFVVSHLAGSPSRRDSITLNRLKGVEAEGRYQVMLNYEVTDAARHLDQPSAAPATASAEAAQPSGD